MITQLLNKKHLVLCLALFFLGIAAQKAQAQQFIARLTTTGVVTVNGKPAATGDTISSGSTVQTAAKSSAVVSLGKLGRVEAQAETKMELRFDDTSITIMLEAGRVRVSTGSGVTATIVRKDE